MSKKVCNCGHYESLHPNGGTCELTCYNNCKAFKERIASELESLRIITDNGAATSIDFDALEAYIKEREKIAFQLGKDDFISSFKEPI